MARLLAEIAPGLFHQTGCNGSGATAALKWGEDLRPDDKVYMAPERAGGSSSSSTARPRYTLDQFQTTGELGAGSFGQVQKVVNVQSGEVFAMKLLEKARVRLKGLEEQLRREVLTQVKVQHPNVVRLHYYFEDAAKIYCLLEFADRGTLFEKLKRLGPKGLEENAAARHFKDTVSGIGYLHGINVAHRDLKPENILLYGAKEVAKIADFGWCVEITEEAPERSTFCGTLDYLSPEMLMSEPHGTPVDLWALGVLLYEMLLAKAPFAHSSQKEAMDRILAVRYCVPPGSIPRAAETMIHGLLVRQPSARMSLEKLRRSPWLTCPVDDEACGNLQGTVVLPRYQACGPLAPNGGPAAAARAETTALDAGTVVVPRRRAADCLAPAALVAGAASPEVPGREAPGAESASRHRQAGYPTASPPRGAAAAGRGGRERGLSLAALDDFLSTVRHAGIGSQDLDGRLLGGPPLDSVSARAGDTPSARSGDTPIPHLIKECIVGVVPRPKAKSQREPVGRIAALW